MGGHRFLDMAQQIILATVAALLLVASVSAYDLDLADDVRAFVEGTEHLAWHS